MNSSSHDILNISDSKDQKGVISSIKKITDVEYVKERVNTQPKKANELLIPADGNCLYTSIFIGYLLSGCHDVTEFKKRFEILTGKSVPDQDSKYIYTGFLESKCNIDILKNKLFKSLIELFKINMKVKNNLWGGASDIKCISKKLNIIIQELFENPDTKLENHYVKSDLTIPDEKSHNLSPDKVIFIVRVSPKPEEAVQSSADTAMQIGQMESVSEGHQHCQHYRVVVSLPLISKNNMPIVPSNSINYSATDIKLAFDQKVNKTQKLKLRLKEAEDEIKLFPNNSMAYLDKAKVLMKLKQGQEAKEYSSLYYFIHALETEEIADSLSDNKDSLAYVIEEIISDYDNAIKINPNFTQAYYEKGRLSNRVGYFTTSIDCFDAVIQLQSDNVGAYYGKAIALYKLSRFEKAGDCCDEGLKQDDRQVDAHFLKGLVLKALEYNEMEVMDCYDKALSIDPQHSDSCLEKAKMHHVWCEYANAAYYYSKAGRFSGRREGYREYREDALDALKRRAKDAEMKHHSVESDFLLSKLPDCKIDPYLYFAMGDSFQQNHNEYAAQVSYADAHYLLGLNAYTRNEFNSAVIIFDRALYALDVLNNKDENARIIQILYRQGRTFEALGKYERAIERYNDVLDLNDNNSVAYYRKARLLEHFEYFSEAVDCYNELIRVDPDDAEVYLRKGCALRKLNCRDIDIMEFYDQALIRNTGYAEAFYQKAELHSAWSQYAMAIYYYDLAIANKLDAEYQDAKLSTQEAIKERQKMLGELNSQSSEYEYDDFDAISQRNFGNGDKLLLVGDVNEALVSYAEGHVELGFQLLEEENYEAAIEQCNIALYTLDFYNKPDSSSNLSNSSFSSSSSASTSSSYCTQQNEIVKNKDFILQERMDNKSDLNSGITDKKGDSPLNGSVIHSVRLNKQLSKIYYCIGRSFDKLDQLDLAIKYYDKVCKVDPTYADAQAYKKKGFG